MKRLIFVLGLIICVSFPVAGYPGTSYGNQPVAFRSFINLFHLDVSRSSLKGEFQKEAVETKILRFKVDPSECFLYPAPERYDYLKVADLKPAAKTGAPQLPMKTFVVELDKGAEVYGVEVVDGLVREIDGELNIVPAPVPSVWEVGAKGGRHIPDEAIYGLAKPFPGKLVSYETGKDNQRQYVFVRLFPVQYTPSKKKAVIVTEATINLYYGPGTEEEGSSAKGSDDGTQTVIEGIASTDAVCIIICPLSLADQADVLTTLHATEGISSTVVTTESIASYAAAGDPPFNGYKDEKLRRRSNIENYDYELAKKIIAYLGDVDAHPNLEYVTILGDGLLVPPSYYYSETGMRGYSNWIPTDFFYASPGYDFVPDYKVGRISVSDDAEALDVISKMTSWRQNVGWGWFGKAYLAGGHAFNTPYYIGEMHTTNAVNAGFFSGMDITKCFHTDGTYTKQCVDAALTVWDEVTEQDIDVGMLYHIGHGSGKSISLDGGDLDVSDLMGYSPDVEVPIVISVSCDNGAFDLDLMSRNYDTSFGEAMLKSQAGGIAYLGGSRHNSDARTYHFEQGNLVIDRIGYNVELLHFALKSYHEVEISGELIDTLGELVYYSVNDYVSSNDMFGDLENVAALFRLVLLGDPALKIPVQQVQTEYQKASCTAENPAYYNADGIPVYGSLPVTINATTNSPTVEWKLIDSNADITLDWYGPTSDKTYMSYTETTMLRKTGCISS